MIREVSGTQLDPEIVSVFLTMRELSLYLSGKPEESWMRSTMDKYEVMLYPMLIADKEMSIKPAGV